MANRVYANKLELACKAGAGKTICAMPDVCFTPPENPATPPGVPVPYPNTGFASDTTEGSKTVMISGKEVRLKNKSYFKKSTGDEAGCAAKKGFINSKNRGKVYFVKWSMDVKFEGENVDRHFDLTTNNHASPIANEAMPWPYIDRMAMGKIKECAKEISNVKDLCGNLDEPMRCPPSGTALRNARSELHKARDEDRELGSDLSRKKKNIAQEKVNRLERALSSAMAGGCNHALRCFLTPFEPNRCCPGQTPDHLIEVRYFIKSGESRDGMSGERYDGWSTYDSNKAPCLCLEGDAAQQSTHGLLSVKRKVLADKLLGKRKGKAVDLDTAVMIGALTASDTFRSCRVKCLAAQLKGYHQSVQEDNKELIKPQIQAIGYNNKNQWAQDQLEEVTRMANKIKRIWFTE